jgi:hypothetical protein
MTEIDPGAAAYLTPLDWPKGLQRSILTSTQVSPLRFFILDDSGSMCCNDGHQLLGRGAAQKYVMSSHFSVRLFPSLIFLLYLTNHSFFPSLP